MCHDYYPCMGYVRSIKFLICHVDGPGEFLLLRFVVNLLDGHFPLLAPGNRYARIEVVEFWGAQGNLLVLFLVTWKEKGHYEWHNKIMDKLTIIMCTGNILQSLALKYETVPTALSLLDLCCTWLPYCTLAAQVEPVQQWAYFLPSLVQSTQSSLGS